MGTENRTCTHRQALTCDVVNRSIVVACEFSAPVDLSCACCAPVKGLTRLVESARAGVPGLWRGVDRRRRYWSARREDPLGLSSLRFFGRADDSLLHLSRDEEGRQCVGIAFSSPYGHSGQHGRFQTGKWIPHPLPSLQYDDQQPIVTCTPIPAEFDSRLLRSRLRQHLERVSNCPRLSAPFS
jgi:hypothetical protein